MRFRFPKVLGRKRNARIVQTNAKTLDMINKDILRYNRMRTALKDGHKPIPSELNAYHKAVEEFGKRSIEVGKVNDKFSEQYYKGLAKKLNNEVMKALRRE